jgi:hypothetical protein
MNQEGIYINISDGRRGPRKRSVLRMLLEDYLRCSGGLAKQATGKKLVVCALCTHRPGGASIIVFYRNFKNKFCKLLLGILETVQYSGIAVVD